MSTTERLIGIDFAIIRCGFGMDEPGQDDDRWEYNVSECERLDIPYGVYLYSYADSTTRASKEADHTLNLLRGHNPQLPVYYDLEETSLESTSNRTLLANMAKTYCNKIENAGYEAGVYSNTNWWNNYLTSSVFDQWDRWVAQYNYECRYEGEYTLWQCTSTGKVDGIKGNVDINFMFNNKYMGPLEKDSNGIRYRNDDGSYAKNEWKTIDGNTYYFGKEGYAVHYEQDIEGNHYYFNSHGVMKTGWVTWVADGRKSYFDSEGHAVTGWQNIDGNRYYFSEDDYRALRYEQDIDGNHYYFNSKGALFKGLLTWEATGLRSYFDPETGIAKTGWITTPEGEKYYFSEKDYRSLRYEQDIEGNHYYFNSHGVMKTGWVTWVADGRKSYFDSEGHAVTGWQNIDGNRYYFSEDDYRLIV